MTRARRDRGARERRAVRASTCATRSSCRSAWTTAGSACPRTATTAYGDRIGLMHNTEGARAGACCAASTRPRSPRRRCPGADGRGPMNQLGRMYEMLLGAASVPACDPVAGRRAISARHRTEMLDETFGVVIDWGLGLAVDTLRDGPALLATHVRSRRPPVVGRVLRSRNTTSCVAVVCNGMPGPRAPSHARARRDRERGLRRPRHRRRRIRPRQAVPDALPLTTRRPASSTRLRG